MLSKLPAHFTCSNCKGKRLVNAGSIVEHEDLQLIERTGHQIDDAETFAELASTLSILKIWESANVS